MSSFITYIDPVNSLNTLLMQTFRRIGVRLDQINDIESFLAVLRIKDIATHDHSIRVGLLSTTIARFMHLDEKAALYAGLLHDLGKAQTNPATLKKTSGWTEEDAQEIRSHVMDGYRMIRGHFDFSAEVILWHHRFQPNSYPGETPIPLHDYSQGTKVMIPLFGRILALADHFDALHRVNSKFVKDEQPVGDMIKKQMFGHNPDQRVLIEELYKAGILTTLTFNESPKP